MIKYLHTLLFTFIATTSFAQPAKEFFNLGAEKLRSGQTLPTRWGDAILPSTKQYIAQTDTTEVHGGQYALFLTPKPGKTSVDSGFIGFAFPGKFAAKTITVKGWLKMQGVQDHAGIMLIVNTLQGKTIAVGSISDKKINGTRNWHQYSFTMPLPTDGATLFAGPVLAGTGKLWADDFEILLDGVDICDAPLKLGYRNNVAVQTNYGENPETGKRVKLKDAELYYEIYGKGKPLLLLHGNGQSISHFSQQIPELAKKYKVIAVDTRGQGKSTDQSTGPLTYEQFADDMMQLLNALNIKKTNIVGWSDGGNTGLIMAIKYPDRVDKLAVTGAVLNSSADAIDSRVFDVINQRLEDLKGKTDYNAVEQRRLNQLMLDEPHISIESLKTIKAPALIMAGDNDVVKDQHTRTIAANIPNSKLLIFKNATHYVPRENSAAFNQAVIEFLK